RPPGWRSLPRERSRGRMRSVFETLPLPENPDVVAPDGSDVRVLLSVRGGSMAHFELPAGRTSSAVRHRTIEEIWYVVAGRGRMWRQSPAPDPASGPASDG